MLDSFRAASGRRQLAIVALLAAVVAALLVAVYVLLIRTQFAVLFSDLRPADGATIVAELDKRKIAYRLENGGATILVPEALVDSTRLGILSQDLPIKGMVGFEIFNSSDLGVTEFAQKINYQRALQGELARTIMTIDLVEAARVHLALGERGIFRDERSPPKASVTITATPGNVLGEAAVRGIRRLVSAAVPDLEPADVVVLDERGGVLGSESAPSQPASPLLVQQQAIERYQAARVRQVLSRTHPGVIAEVMVSARFDGDAGGFLAADSDASVAGPVAGPVAAPGDSGAERRRNFGLNISLRPAVLLSADRRDALSLEIADALGLDPARGDSVEVLAEPAGSVDMLGSVPASIPLPVPPVSPSPSSTEAGDRGVVSMLWPAAMLLIGMGVLLVAWRARSGDRRGLSDAERRAYAVRLKRLLDGEDAHAAPRA